MLQKHLDRYVCRRRITLEDEVLADRLDQFLHALLGGHLVNEIEPLG